MVAGVPDFEELDCNPARNTIKANVTSETMRLIRSSLRSGQWNFQRDGSFASAQVEQFWLAMANKIRYNALVISPPRRPEDRSLTTRKCRRMMARQCFNRKCVPVVQKFADADCKFKE